MACARRKAAWQVWLAALIHVSVVGAVALEANGQAGAPQVAIGGLPAVRTGAQIYQAACVACHGPDGKGQPRGVVGFDTPLPDFSDCAFASGEPDPDWQAVVHRGGRIRGLDQRMPAFGDALSAEDIASVISHVRTFCAERARWPQGDLNFPRAFFTEKAFPENETVWTTAVTGRGSKRVANTLIYERRIGTRQQVELVVPLDFVQTGAGTWAKGLGDVAVAFKRAFYASMETGAIASAGAEIIFPTGKEGSGLGDGYVVYEPFAMYGQALPRSSFLQVHGGLELPSVGSATREAFIRTAIGTTIAQDSGFGRAWSPQVEVIWARPFGGSSEWDVVPQIQISLSKMQHVLVATGVRIPVNQRQGRPTQVLAYFLWDWFDGGLFEFWK